MIRLYYRNNRLVVPKHERDYEVQGDLLKSCLIHRCSPMSISMRAIEREAPKRADAFLIGDLIKKSVSLTDVPRLDERIKYFRIEGLKEINRTGCLDLSVI